MSTTDIQPARANARDMTDDERQAWAEWAHGVEARVQNARNAGITAWWDMAEALFEFEDDGGWKALGKESLNDWLAQPEINLTRTVYYRAIGMWKALVVERRIAAPQVRALEPSRVDEVMPAIKKGTVLTAEALADAEALGVRDLRDKYRAAKPKNATVPTSGHSEAEPVAVPGMTGDEAANVATSGDATSGQVVVEANGTDPVVTVTESPSAPPDIEGSAQDVEPANAAEAPGDEATAAFTDDDLKDALDDLTSAHASGQPNLLISRRTAAVLIDYINDAPTEPEPLVAQMAQDIIDAQRDVVDAFTSLPERARTKHLPKPVREAIARLAELIG